MKYLYIFILIVTFTLTFIMLSKLQDKINKASNQYAKYIIEQTKWENR